MLPLSRAPLHFPSSAEGFPITVLLTVMHRPWFPFVVALFIGVSLAEPLERRSITCLKVGSTATARWTNSAGQSCTWSGTVGSNFGTNSVNGGECVDMLFDSRI